MSRSESPGARLTIVALVCGLGCALALAGCSSSDDVVAVYDPTAELEPPAAAAGSTLRSGAQPVPSAATVSGAPVPGTPVPVATALPVAGGARASGGSLPPPPLTIDAESLRVMGAPASPPRADAVPWPLDTPLQQYFSRPPVPAPASQIIVFIVHEPDATLLRELGADHGLGECLPPAQVRVEDEAGDQFELTLWEEQCLMP